jgi:transcriptional regulator EpsA
MSFFFDLPFSKLSKFLSVIQDGLRLRCHMDLFLWLQGEVQEFLPHDILIAAWGDFHLGLVHLDVMSDIPGLRTTEVDQQDLLPFLSRMFELWLDSPRKPFTLPINDGTFDFSAGLGETDLERGIMQMRRAVVHGMKDERGRHDCLYVILSKEDQSDAQSMPSVELLLPYIDAALRQVAHLPSQYRDLPEPLEGSMSGQNERLTPGEFSDQFAFDLSQREHEIMQWVAKGKTNPEIGTILNISAFTVKNHLQRIFRKLDVINRAQAVAQFERTGLVANAQ